MQQPQHSALPRSSNLLDELLLDTDILEKARPFLDVDLAEEGPLGTLSAPLSKEQFQALLYILSVSLGLRLRRKKESFPPNPPLSASSLGCRAVKERKENKKQRATLMILSCSKTKKRLVSGKLAGSTSMAKVHTERQKAWAPGGAPPSNLQEF